MTDRGYQAFEHGLERAKTYLAYQARCLEVSFAGTWKQLHSITLDHTVFLEDPRLPGGKLQGKVIAYCMIAEGETGSQRVEVTLGVNAGAGEMPEAFKAPKDETPYSPGYSEAGYHVSSPQQLQQSPTGIFYERYDHQKPEDPFATLAYQKLAFFIQQLQLKNSAHEQEDFLKTMEATGYIDKSSLKEKPTELQLKFAPLKGKETMLHTIHATVRSGYTSPRQVG